MPQRRKVLSELCCFKHVLLAVENKILPPVIFLAIPVAYTVAISERCLLFEQLLCSQLPICSVKVRDGLRSHGWCVVC